MSKGGAHFSSQELARVLSHYDIGVIHKIDALSAGSRRVPKVVVTSEKGKFVLKRRPRGKDDLALVTFAHAVQTHLADKNFPVASLVPARRTSLWVGGPARRTSLWVGGPARRTSLWVGGPTRDASDTTLHLDNHIYEFFTFVSGARYDGSYEATIQAGWQLARLHNCLADFSFQDGPMRVSFHDSTTVRRLLKTLGVHPSQPLRGGERAAKKAVSDKNLQTTADALLNLYNDSSIRINKLGYGSWQQQVVHGDWHPGNMLFSEGKLTAVLDFDSVKIAPPVTDVANGMLQFSIVACREPKGRTSGRPNPADWPDYFDQDKLLHLLNGYLEVSRLDKDKLNSLIDLMVETMIAEAVLPVAATGFFGDFTGLDFLQIIRRKADWLSKNRQELTEAINS
jgi:Ser/Thr protein kinase RdoA (MazF antagonist)